MKYLLAALLICSSFCGWAQPPVYLIVGTYTSSGSEGIYTFAFDTASGKANLLGSASSNNPSYLAIAPDGKSLYAVNENAGAKGNGGQVLSYRFNKENGSLENTGQQPSLGSNPCYVATDAEGKWLAVGNYSSGTMAVYQLTADGGIGPLVFSAKHSGSGPDSTRQQTPHVHATVFSPNGKFLYVPDLGADKIFVYALNQSGNWQPPKTPFVATAPGSGPRHFVFHPAKPYAYLINELSGKVNFYKFNCRNGRLREAQTISALPAGYTGAAGSADIHLSADGKFLYSSNRAEINNLAIFSVNRDGRLTLKGQQPVLGKTPRNFSIDPSGKFLLVANQNSDEIVVFKRDTVSGLLTDSGERIPLKKPVCIKWISTENH